MKKTLTLLLALLMAVALVACTNAPATNEENNNEVEENDIINGVGEDLEEPAGDNVVVELPEVDAGNEPAQGTEEENVPPVMPEVEPETEDVPAVMPEVVPEVTPEVVPEEIPEAEDAPEADKRVPSDVTIDTLYELADKLYEGIDPENMPMVGTMELNSENFEYSAFVPFKTTYLAVESMPMMGSQPHSVVIVKTDSEEEAASLAAEMEANANPRKWICVSAKSVKSAHKGEYALLVMTTVDVMPGDDIDEAKAEEMSYEKSEERANIIINNFLAAVK